MNIRQGKILSIGILSMQEVKNYGSFLQAFSLKNIIETLGCHCSFVNIIPGKQLPGYQVERFHKIKLLLERLRGRDFLKRGIVIFKFQNRFAKEFLPYLGVKSGRTQGHFDIIVIGSDEVFNCTQKTWFGFSPQLFGKGLDTDEIITYAASFGSTTVEKLEQLGIRNEVAGYLNNINQFSVRDDNSQEIIRRLTGKDPQLHVDPVFIYDYSKFVPNEKHTSDYIIVYSYPGRISDPKEITSIQDFASKKGLRLLSIGHYFTWCDDVVVPTPFEVLAWFRDAAYIITDTFHGSVFSIKYNKKFVAIVREMNKQKLTYLLKFWGLENRIVSEMSLLSSIIDCDINYTLINQKIAEERMKSIDYLRSNLQ